MYMTFADIFNPAAPTAQALQSQPAPVPAAGNTPTPANPTTVDQFPKSQTPDPVAQQTAPLEPFKDLFTVDPTKQQEDPNAPFITYDKAQLNEAVNRMDFLEGEGVQEMVALAAKGDPAALMTLIQTATRNAYAKGAELSANVANRAALGSTERNSQRLPEAMRSNLAADALASLNATLLHPAIAPQTQQVLAAMSQKFPTATPQELAKHTSDYFTAAYQASQVKEAPNPRSSNPANPGQQDFTDFFGSSRR